MSMPPSCRLDIACGGGVRQFVAARLGMHAAGFDLRADAVADCTDKAARLKWLDPKLVRFVQGDMRDIGNLVRRLGRGWPKFGGLFISPPFYKVEKYDLAQDGTQRQPPQRGLLEHCASYAAFLQAFGAVLYSPSSPPALVRGLRLGYNILRESPSNLLAGSGPWHSNWHGQVSR
jgi:SAM-dependent methyltransferase